MTTITINRAVVEQALHVAENAGYPLALIKALRAALAQEQEPAPMPGQEQVTYSTGGFQLEAGFYSADQLREMLKALESMNAAARRAMKEMT